MTPQEIDRIECAIRHIESSLDVDPWAVEIAVEAMKKEISALQAQDKALHEFCTDCKEYDQERHCCPRFNRVISETLKEVQSAKDINVRGKDTVYRQDAIDALGEEPPVWYDGEDEIAERNQWRRDVEAIKQLPSAEPERKRNGAIDMAIEALNNSEIPNSSDCISRQAAIDAVNNLTYPSSLVDVKRILVDLPSAQPPHFGRRVYQAGYADGAKAARKENT